MDTSFPQLSKKELQEQKRHQERERIRKEEQFKKFRLWGIIALVIVAVIGGFWWLIKESTKPLPGKSFADQGRKHIPQKEWEKFKYNSNPPTSGSHDEVWTKPGIYSSPQGDGHLVHSLEHGYIVIWYDCDLKSETAGDTSSKDCQDLKKQLKDIANENRIWKLVVVPRNNMDSKIVLTAWTRLEKLDTPDKQKIKEFIDAFRNNGPEQTME